MTSFRYQAREATGGVVTGFVEAVDRQGALSLLTGQTQRYRPLFRFC